MSVPEFFKPSANRPKHEIYGYGSLEPGEETAIHLAMACSPVGKIRSMIYSHASYHGKRFRTTERDGYLYVYRIS